MEILNELDILDQRMTTPTFVTPAFVLKPLAYRLMFEISIVIKGCFLCIFFSFIVTLQIKYYL